MAVCVIWWINTEFKQRLRRPVFKHSMLCLMKITFFTNTKVYRLHTVYHVQYKNITRITKVFN